MQTPHEVTTATDRAHGRRRYRDGAGREWVEYRSRPKTKPAPALESPRTPEGFRPVQITVWTDGRHVIVPEQEPFWLPCEDEPAEGGHDCDANGCGWEHVLARFDLPKGGGAMKTEAEIREQIGHHRASLEQWQSGYLTPTEPDPGERAAVMRELKASIFTLEWVLAGAPDEPKEDGE